MWRATDDATWRNPRHGDRWRATAVTVSVGLHLLIALGLFLQHADAPFGALGSDLGTGMQVSLVSGFAAGGPDAGKLETSAPDAETEREQSPLRILEAAGGAPAADEEPTPSDRQTPTERPSEASMARGEAGQAAGAFEGAAGARDSQGGDPLAVSDLLAQIARCLRPDFRPALGFSRLTLSIGPDGRLRVPPAVTSTLLRMSASDRRAADQIVQAALLCGPYAHPDAVNRIVALPADFSTIHATVAAGEKQSASAPF